MIKTWYWNSTTKQWDSQVTTPYLQHEKNFTNKSDTTKTKRRVK